MATFTDREIIAGFKSGLNVESITQFLYRRTFKSVRNMVIKRGGNKQDAEDIFQDSLIIMIEIISSDSFSADGPASLSTYLHLIASRLWSKRQIRERKKEIWHQQFMYNTELFENMIGKLEDQLTAIQLLDRLSPTCQNILRAYYIEGYSIREIAESMESNEVAIRQKKLRCLRKLKDLL